MKFTTLFGVNLAILGAAQAGVITSRQAAFDFECNGQQLPDLDDCNDLFSLFTDGTKTYTHPANANLQYFTTGETNNCLVEITWYDMSYTVTGNQLYQGINGVATTCFTTGTGGYANDLGNRFQIGVRNNPNYNPPEKRDSSKLIPMGKRADSDTSFSYGVHTTYAKPASMRHNIGAGLPGGSTWEWSSEKSVTDSVTFSTSVSAGLEGVLSASLGTEISSSVTTTSGSATTITINCADNQYGQVYFQGYAEIWQGVLQPSNDPLTVTKPMTQSDGSTAGFYSYECVSK